MNNSKELNHYVNLLHTRLLTIIFLSLFQVQCNNKQSRDKASPEQNIGIGEFKIKTSLITPRKDSTIENIKENKLRLSEDIADYVPEELTQHDDLINFLRNYLNYAEDYYDHLHNNIKSQAQLDQSTATMEKSNEKGDNIAELFQNTYKAYKKLKKSAKGITKTVWNGRHLLELERERKELKSKYTSEVWKRYLGAENTIDKYLYYSYVLPQKEELSKINHRTNFRTKPANISHELYAEMGFDDLVDRFDKVQDEAKRVRKILSFNKMVIKIEDDPSNEIDTFYGITGKPNISTKDVSPIFRDIVSSLIDIRAILRNKYNSIKEQEDWNRETKSAIKNIFDRFDIAINNEISRLKINELPSTGWKMFKNDY